MYIINSSYDMFVEYNTISVFLYKKFVSDDICLVQLSSTSADSETGYEINIVIRACVINTVLFE